MARFAFHVDASMCLEAVESEGHGPEGRLRDAATVESVPSGEAEEFSSYNGSRHRVPRGHGSRQEVEGRTRNKERRSKMAGRGTLSTVGYWAVGRSVDAVGRRRCKPGALEKRRSGGRRGAPDESHATRRDETQTSKEHPLESGTKRSAELFKRFFRFGAHPLIDELSYNHICGEIENRRLPS